MQDLVIFVSSAKPRLREIPVSAKEILKNSAIVSIDDWTPYHQNIASKQGWKLVDTDSYGSRVEVHCTNVVPTLDLNDYTAVANLKEAYLNNEDHAILAFNILKYHSVVEFQHWAMDSWVMQKPKNLENNF